VLRVERDCEVRHLKSTFPGVSCPRWGPGLQPQEARLHKHSTDLTGNKKIPIAGIHFVGRWARRCSRGPRARALPVVRRDIAHGGVYRLWRTGRSEPVRVASFRMDAALEPGGGPWADQSREDALSGSRRRREWHIA